nr:S8 family serine peptidase [Variovorax sp. PCZ-1]
MVGWGNTPSCNQRVLIGMIDTRVDRQHASLHGQAIELHSARAADRAASDASHGTAIASLMLGKPEGPLPGLLPRAKLLAVDAFHQGPRSDNRMDAFDFAAALDWLVQRGVKVVNLSFSGPHNMLIESSIQAAQKRGVILVAAVGNDGPTASPRFPAAYPGVIAVTAVRTDLQVFRRAVRGEHLSLSAPGVDVKVADTTDASATVLRSGTSYAVPFVSAAAALLQANGVGKSGAAAVHQHLIKTSLDLGPAGFDSMFGHGLLQMGAVCKMPSSGMQAKSG